MTPAALPRACSTFRDELELRRDGLLAATAAEASRAHETRCADCGPWVAATDALVAGLDGLPPEPYGPSTPPGGTAPDAPPIAGPGSPTPPGGGPTGGPLVWLALVAALGLGGSSAWWALRDGSAVRRNGPATARRAAEQRTLPAERGRGPADRRTAEVARPSTAVPSSGGFIRGRVVDGHGRPVSGAEVAATDGPAVISDAAGVFLLGGLPGDASVGLVVRVPGGPDATRLVAGVPRGAVRLLDDLVAATAEVRVRAVTPRAQPIAGVALAVRPLAIGSAPDDNHAWPAPEDAAPRRHATTGDDGVAVFPGVPEGPFLVDVVGPGPRPQGPRTFHTPEERSAEAPPTLVLEPGRRLAGRVVDDADGRPVPDVRVVLRRLADVPHEIDDFRTTRAVRTDGEGRFVFDAVPAAVVHLRADGLDGLELVSATLDAAAIGEVELRLPPRRELHLRTIRTDGTPVPGVQLRVGTTGHEAHVESGPDGAVRLADVPVGSPVVWRCPRGTPWVPATARIPAPGPENGTPADPLDLVVLPGATIEGLVVDAGGTPLTGARVSALGIRYHPARTGGVVVASVLADAGGGFTMTLPGPDSIVFVPGIPDPEAAHRIARAAADGVEGLEPRLVSPGVRVPVVVRRTAAATGGSARDPRPLAVAGRVRGPDGRPIAGTRAWAVPHGGPRANALAGPRNEVFPLAVDGGGNFSARLPRTDRLRRRWSVVARAPGFRPAVAVVEVEGGPLDLRLEAGRTVAGRVRTTDGHPLADAVIRITPAGRGAVRWKFDAARTGTDGAFRVEGVDEGPVTVQVRPSDASDPIPFGPYDDASALDLRIPARIAVTGRVRLTTGAPAGGARVAWRSASRPAHRGSVAAGSDGVYRLEDMPREPLHFDLLTGNGEGAVSLRRTAVGPVEPGTGPLDFDVEPALVVGGRVTLDDGAAPGAGWITATSADGSTVNAVLDAEGRFRAGGLPAGTLRLTAHGRGFTQAEPVIVEAGATDVVLQVAATAAPSPPIALAIVVRDAAGRPMPRATIAARSGGSRDAFTRSAVTDADGSARLETGGAGPVDLLVTTSDGRRWHRDAVPATAGRVVFRLHDRTGGLAGVVLGPDGRARSGTLVVAVRRPGDGHPTPVAVTCVAHVLDGAPGTGPEVRVTRTDAEGRFDLGAPAGSWWVVAGMPGREGPVGAAVATWARGSEGPPDLIANPGRRLRLRVEPHARLDLRIPTGPDGPTWTLTLHAGPDGTIDLPGLPPGPVTVVRPGGASGERSVQVVPGEPDGPFIELR